MAADEFAEIRRRADQAGREDVISRGIRQTVDREDWLRPRAHAARRGMPITSVFWERLQPLIDKLRRDIAAADEA